jgi:hypothetical protein
MTARCNVCGQEWPRDPALEVECPKCHAPVGSDCKRPSGHRAFGGQPHADRDRAALAAGKLGKCPGKHETKPPRKKREPIDPVPPPTPPSPKTLEAWA